MPFLCLGKLTYYFPSLDELLIFYSLFSMVWNIPKSSVNVKIFFFLFAKLTSSEKFFILLITITFHTYVNNFIFTKSLRLCNSLSNGRCVNILTVSCGPYHCLHSTWMSLPAVFLCCTFIVVNHFIFVICSFSKNATWAYQWQKRRPHSYKLCCLFMNWCTDQSLTGCERSDVSDISDHDAYVLLTWWFVDCRASREICSLCSYS